MKHKPRPLSPHLQIYKPQITSVTSILHRITGNALLVPVVLLVWWLWSIASGQASFNLVNSILTSWIGDLIMLCGLWGLWYHFLAGLRHVYWLTTGQGLAVHTAERFGYAIIIGACVLTGLTLILF